MTPATAESASTNPGAPADHAHTHPDALGAYIKVFVTLMILLVATVLAYKIPFEELTIDRVNFGFMNTVVALIIATVKASLVVLVFMHLRHSTKLTWIVAGAGFVFLSIMILFTFIDYQSRGTIKENTPPAPTKSYESMVKQEDSKQLNQTLGW